MFPRIKHREERIQAARDEWESKFSISECLNSEDRDYLAERVESIPAWKTAEWAKLKEWLSDKQEAHFIAWMESVEAENDYQRSEALSRERDYQRFAA